MSFTDRPVGLIGRCNPTSRRLVSCCDSGSVHSIALVTLVCFCLFTHLQSSWCSTRENVLPVSSNILKQSAGSHSAGPLEKKTMHPKWGASRAVMCGDTTVFPTAADAPRSINTMRADVWSRKFSGKFCYAPEECTAKESTLGEQIWQGVRQYFAQLFVTSLSCSAGSLLFTLKAPEGTWKSLLLWCSGMDC